ncbi:hypothetical protein RO3G_10318 [Rhizopus delemar RA 99-880]|uniref:PIN domain-containing protein n=1 Tax=Rhizopus delemar (strain RA 99-880 / ATCC MYA-4621 / FGSC 9543 / NRRL 43880) TaxID=246409 RepID=I1CAX8_RHIO9|nr:hypothetical protein RO3G_10318 [Rhizopus delemar RA 99-880]|eukprot:EIE85608.1 hypothetical protein RO3G_10318 [Rhizopus delemar RA 99-880]
MDIDGPEFINEVNAQIESIRSHHQDVTLDVSLFNINYKDVHSFSQIAVVDTNFLISNLGYLQALLTIAEERLGNLLILIPWVVIRELDGLKGFLKSSADKKDLPILSRKAMKFIEDQLRNKTKSLRGQKLHETMNSKSMQIVAFMVHDIDSISAESKPKMEEFLNQIGQKVPINMKKEIIIQEDHMTMVNLLHNIFKVVQ